MVANKKAYAAREFDLGGLNGISDQTLDMHFKLYQGYVKNTNLLNEQLAGIVGGGKVPPEQVPVFSELKRRLGWEYNGMVLHEYYFENLQKGGGTGDPAKDAAFRAAAEASFGGYDVWKADFSAVGAMRGVGWAICYQDPNTKVLNNLWIDLHETNNIAGHVPILVMDVWEHAFLLDYKPADRPKYIEAFLSNVDWGVVEERTK